MVKKAGKRKAASKKAKSKRAKARKAKFKKAQAKFDKEVPIDKRVKIELGKDKTKSETDVEKETTKKEESKDVSKNKAPELPKNQKIEMVKEILSVLGIDDTFGEILKSITAIFTKFTGYFKTLMLIIKESLNPILEPVIELFASLTSFIQCYVVPAMEYVIAAIRWFMGMITMAIDWVVDEIQKGLIDLGFAQAISELYMIDGKIIDTMQAWYEDLNDVRPADMYKVLRTNSQLYSYDGSGRMGIGTIAPYITPIVQFQNTQQTVNPPDEDTTTSEPSAPPPRNIWEWNSIFKWFWQKDRIY